MSAEGWRMWRAALVAVVATFLGCVHEYESGRRYSYEDTQKLTPGVSTRADAERLFGPPASVTRSTDGAVFCSWSYVRVGARGVGGGHKILLITFRPDGTYDKATETASGEYAPGVPVTPP